MENAAIELTGLTKYYGIHRGVENLSLRIEEGEVFGFIGPNGAGKTTTIRTLMGLIRPGGGSAAIFGRDCRTQAAEIAAEVGYLPGEDSCYGAMTVAKFLQYTAELYGKDCKSKTAALTERLHLEPARKIGDLSLGNRRKVGIVAALMTAPRLILLDEPTSGLDPLARQEFYEILREEHKRGATIFLSSHVLSEVQRLCDRAAILKEGHLVGIQSIRDLRERGYKKVTVTAYTPLPQGAFEMPGIANYSPNALGTSATFLYNGPVAPLLAKLDALSLQDALLEEPSLEEIFLHYYE